MIRWLLDPPVTGHLLFSLIFFLISCTFGILEYNAFSAKWQYLKYNYFLYARPSLVFASMALVLCFSSIEKVPHKVILSISNASLGIYLVHTIIRHYFTNMFKSYSITIFFLSVLLLSYITVTVLRMVSEKKWRIV